jgi:hypothetical protein
MDGVLEPALQQLGILVLETESLFSRPQMARTCPRSGHDSSEEGW